VPPQKDIEFVSNNYPLITTGTGCGGLVNQSNTIEQAVLAVGARIKAVNSKAMVGMYWRSDFALELKTCSGFADEWNAHEAAWTVKADDGTTVPGKAYINYSNPDAAAFFQKVLVNVTLAQTPAGAPIIDYIYIDGDPSMASCARGIRPGVSPERSLQLCRDWYATFSAIQRQLAANGHAQKIVENGVDDAAGAATHLASGAPSSMFDHWSILQFLDRKTGAFNATMMDEAFALVRSLPSNFSVLVKGWPGPIVKQKDQYPPTIPTPKTPAELQKVAGERFNSELALFLLVAEATDFWLYSWFWGWDDWVPGEPTSSVPAGFFPQAKCALGAPKGPYARGAGATYTRQFEQASVFVDLLNRTNSKVEFAACQL
jgi:hypothetical protein